MSDETNEQGEKTGTGIIGGAAAVGAGVAAGKYTGWKMGTNSQATARIETALTETLAAGADAKAVDFQKAVKTAAGKAVKEGETLTFGEKILAAKDKLAKTGADALSKDAKKLAQTELAEGLKGIKAGLKEAKVSTLTAGNYGKAAIVAIPAAIVTKIALDKMFGGHAAKVEAERVAPDQGAGRA